MTVKKIAKGSLSPKIDVIISQLQDSVPKSLDVVIRPIRMGNGQMAASFYIDGLINKEVLGLDFYAPLQAATREGRWSVEEIRQSVLQVGDIKIIDDLDMIIDLVLQGMTALFVEGETYALVIEMIQWQQRSIDEPNTDNVIRGPREGFVETLRINVSMIRRKIHHKDFIAETVRVGRYSNTDVALVYVSSIVNKDVLAELKRRLKNIDIDAILDSGGVEQLIEDKPYSFFPTIGITEKPDITAAKILEGRVALIVDGSPIVLTVPMLFVEGLQSPEDYYSRFYFACFMRIIRVFALLISLFLPAIYIAVVGYDQQMIPISLLQTMLEAEATTPFSTGLSVLLISIIYELLRESSVRLPKAVGQAVSIVGAIVLGQAAVTANLISAPVLIVLAVTVTASFCTVAFTDATTILRFIFIFFGWTLGLFGVLITMFVLLAYLCSIKTFGVAYLSPLSPFNRQGMKDTALRFPLWKLSRRPSDLSLNRRRMGNMQPPFGQEEATDEKS